jgi:5-methylcytosine-specific restriction endonuclease McrA
MSVKKVIAAQEKGGILVLNQSYEPIGTSPLTRVMLKLSLANSPFTVEEWSKDTLHSGRGEEYPKPSVVRLKRYIDVPRKSAGSRKDIYERDNYQCQFCGESFPAKDLTLDHIDPKSRGGSNDPRNLATACKRCNNYKGARTPEEAGMPLLKPMVAYRVRLGMVRLLAFIKHRPEWEKYLVYGEDSAESALMGKN